MYRPHSEAEECGLVGVALHLELDEGSGVAFNRLRNLSLHRVQLHGAHHTVLVRRRRNADQQQPVLRRVSPGVISRGITNQHIMLFTCAEARIVNGS